MEDRMEEIIDASVIDNDTITLNDGIDSLVKILGGISVVAAEKKKLLQTKDPTVLQGALKSVGVLGASLVGIGSSIAKFAARNIDTTDNK